MSNNYIGMENPEIRTPDSPICLVCNHRNHTGNPSPMHWPVAGHGLDWAAVLSCHRSFPLTEHAQKSWKWQKAPGSEILLLQFTAWCTSNCGSQSIWGELVWDLKSAPSVPCQERQAQLNSPSDAPAHWYLKLDDSQLHTAERPRRRCCDWHVISTAPEPPW